ncbi:hypothetical protein ACX0G9_02225 [Flavitalea flava]
MKYLVVCLSLINACVSCRPLDAQERYQALVREQLAGAERHEKLLLDLTFGMAKPDFFYYCQKMHARKLFTNANNNHSVLYQSDTTFRSTVTWRFYPEFHDARITALRAGLSYNAYSPWNRHLGADSLLKDIINVFSRWYGPDHFMVMKRKEGGNELVKVDGNRQITIYRVNDKDVEVDYTDLLQKENSRTDVPSL